MVLRPGVQILRFDCHIRRYYFSYYHRWSNFLVCKCYFDIFIQRPSSREWDNSMIIKLHWQQITNWFDNLVKLFPNRRGQTQKGVDNTSPVRGVRVICGEYQSLPTNATHVFPSSTLVVYIRGGETFLIAGQIWKLFFIEGCTIQRSDDKVTISARQKKIWSFYWQILTKFLVVKDLYVAFSLNRKRFKGLKNKSEGSTLAMSGPYTYTYNSMLNEIWFFSGEMSVIYLYVVSEFNWTYSEYGYYNTYRFVVNIVGKKIHSNLGVGIFLVRGRFKIFLGPSFGLYFWKIKNWKWHFTYEKLV